MLVGALEGEMLVARAYGDPAQFIAAAGCWLRRWMPLARACAPAPVPVQRAARRRVRALKRCG